MIRIDLDAEKYLCREPREPDSAEALLTWSNNVRDDVDPEIGNMKIERAKEWKI